MKNEVEQVLDHCLTQIHAGRMTLEQALEAHPGHADELRILLSLAIQTRVEFAPEDPDAAYIRDSRRRIVRTVRSSSTTEKRSAPKHRRFLLRPRYALAIIALLAVLFGSGFGVYSASASSLPGDALYPVKRAGEEIQLAASFSNQGDLALLLEFAQRRLGEVESLIDAGRYDDLDQALNGLEREMDRIEEQSGAGAGPAAPVDQLQDQLEKHIQNLERVRDQVPENARSSIEKALDRSRHSQDVLEALRGGEKPSDLAPGQQESESGKIKGPKDPNGANGSGRPEDPGKPKDKEDD